MNTPIPASVRGYYAEVSDLLRIGKDYAHGRLIAELNDQNPVVIQSRVKTIDSVYAKLQRGEAARISDIDDLIAIRAVFLHPKQVEAAIDITQKTFPITDRRNLGAGQPTDFRYQQPHLIGNFPNDWLERHQELSSVKLEFQFTTYIQHALQESTHDVIYKGARFSWREHRLDGQLRGLLEIVDDVLANLSNVATVEGEPEYKIFDSRNKIIEACESLWPGAMLPNDRRRMAITIEGYLGAAKLDVSDFLEMAVQHQDLVAALSLGPVDKILGILLRERGSDFVKSLKKKKFIVSPELEGLVPEADLIPLGQRVQLTID